MLCYLQLKHLELSDFGGHLLQAPCRLQQLTFWWFYENKGPL